ncbi:hypothetical protein H7I87_02965 [Mycobacterium timonense]|uniref:Uncharacterized protein n=3 Tax=Mycobacterium avium complex (MAC) TaxID=120793 RepID=A0AAW5S8I3_MYCBC|nr:MULTISPECIES: hypothetical protein [Mycobacterium avium complex (MAC)]MCV6991870.1 hypothetical protein [Mycobacterium bouchedurhonense]MCV6993691.1 hypothetical protein [Mycobacterium timonense]MDV3306802.1 hypothetical protein [Mycobacterium avium subsp. hominissuis]ORA45737.1 hypothetical protein BST19_19740 [Mycobacterium bouchedurhonense]
MTVEFYDLAQRLYAAQVGQPVLRVARPLFTLSADSLLVHASRDGDTVSATIATITGPAVTVTGAAAVMAALHAAGARFDGETARQLVVPDAATMTVLAGAARALRLDGDRAVAEASAVVGWWLDRTGYPGTGAVINLLAHSRQRYITGGVPGDERAAAYWRRVFGVAEGVAGLGQWAAILASGEPIDSLAPVLEDDHYTYRSAGKRFSDGGDWTVPDSPATAALGLRRRCNAAELWESVLLEDRLWRHRAVHTGTVTGGVVVDHTGTRFTVACERMDSRLREGAQVRGWPNGIDSFDRSWPFVGEITATEAIDGALHLTVSGVRAEARPNAGEWVSLMPAAPNSRRVNSDLYNYRRLLTSKESWITAGKTPGRFSREVPLDVLIAAAETE